MPLLIHHPDKIAKSSKSFGAEPIFYCIDQSAVTPVGVNVSYQVANKHIRSDHICLKIYDFI